MYPKKLYLEVTTNCNMSCGMCVKQAPGSSISNKHLNIAVFNKLLPHMQTLVLNGIGEPLLHPDLLWMIPKLLNKWQISELTRLRISELARLRTTV